MTQDEVDIIYDYLHENYEYRDGELIALKTRGNIKKGKSLGHFFIPNNKGRANMRAGITINGKNRFFYLDKLIWLFHYKNWSNCLIHINKNPLDNHIENLKNTTLHEIQYKNIDSWKGTFSTMTKSGLRHFPNFFMKGKVTVGLGGYSSQEEASFVYKEAKKIYMNNLKLTPIDIQKELLRRYPRLPIKFKPKLKGAYQDGTRWVSALTINKRKIHLGQFDTPEEAHAAYLKAKEEYKNERQNG